jgi:TonB family protein
VTREFVVPTKGSVSRLLEKVREKGEGITGATGLDRPLKPIWQAKPTYPSKMLPEKISGQAAVECIIDRDGRARLPRVKSATREEFGWAAATAISQWVFERPLRKGEPVDVTVTIPVNFNPPKS